MNLGHETQIDYGTYIEEQAAIGRRDDFEHYERHKSPRDPCEGDRVKAHRIEDAVLDLQSFQQECCGEMIPGTGDCELGGVCPNYFTAKRMVRNGHSYEDR